MKWSYGIATAAAILAAGTMPGGVAKAAVTAIQSNAAVFDARADGAASTYCIDMPAVLVGQQICGGFLRSTVTATSDPRGFALGGLAPVPKLSSVPLLIPNNVQGIPVPAQVQAGLKQIKFNNIPSQCQAAFPVVNDGDNDQTCGGPTYGNSALGFIGSDANAHVYSTGDAANPTQTRTTADSRAALADLTGLQTTYDNVRALSQSGLNADGNPMGESRMNAGRVAFLGGAFTIDGIVSSTRVAFNGAPNGAAVSTSFNYAGASFAGIPVQITPDGLTLATSRVPADQAKAMTQQLNKLLGNNQGFGVKLLPAPPAEVTGSLARATSSGIEVTYRSSTGTDVVYTQIIGVTSAQVSAVPIASAAGVPAGTGSGVAGTTVDSASPGSAGTPATGVGNTDSLPGARPVGGALTAGAPDEGLTAGAAPTVELHRQVGDQTLLADFPTGQPAWPSRLHAIYPVFCALALAAFAIARLRRRPLRENLG
jgi:hypothetical protein